MHEAVFVTLVVPGTTDRQAWLLVHSLRDFGGSLADAPVLGMVPAEGPRLSRADAAAFEGLGVRLVPFDVDLVLRAVPFGAKAAATARAETVGGTRRMVWLDPDVLVLGDAGEFLIPDGVALGYRPVHHRLVGPAWDGPPDPYWQAVYDVCGVPGDRIFRMTTNVGEAVQAYVNAGVFVVRPERGLARQWPGALAALARDPRIAARFREDRRYEVFLHQAAWTAVALRTLDRSEMLELSPAVNYPFHLHHEIPAARRAISLASLTAVRTEDVLDDPEWPDRHPLLASLAPWVEAHRRTAG